MIVNTHGIIYQLCIFIFLHKARLEGSSNAGGRQTGIIASPKPSAVRNRSHIYSSHGIEVSTIALWVTESGLLPQERRG